MFPNEADTSILLFYNQFMLKLLLAPKKSQKKKQKTNKLENAEVMAIDEGMKETDSKCAHRNWNKTLQIPWVSHPYVA